MAPARRARRSGPRATQGPHPAEGRPDRARAGGQVCVEPEHARNLGEVTVRGSLAAGDRVMPVVEDDGRQVRRALIREGPERAGSHQHLAVAEQRDHVAVTAPLAHSECDRERRAHRASHVQVGAVAARLEQRRGGRAERRDVERVRSGCRGRPRQLQSRPCPAPAGLLKVEFRLEDDGCDLPRAVGQRVDAAGDGRSLVGRPEREALDSHRCE